MICSSHAPQPAARQAVLQLLGREASLRGPLGGSTAAVQVLVGSALL